MLSLTVSLFLTIDPSLGRIDKPLLPQVDLMELFVKGITNIDNLYSPLGIPQVDPLNDISGWPNVSLNDIGEVEEISWPFKQLAGTIDLQWVPDSTKTLILSFNYLFGSLDLTQLPICATSVCLQQNSFSGSVDLSDLPKNLQVLDLHQNHFSGPVSLDTLPASLDMLWIHDCAFCGTISLKNLPKNMTDLNISNNDFEGFTDFTSTPKNLDVSDNVNLSGEYRKVEDRIFSATNTKVVVIE